MAKIAKVYRTIWKDGNNLTASDTRRAFDDAYDLVNGGLEKVNFVNSLSYNQDGVGVNSNAFTSTLLIGAIREIASPGYHNLHFLGAGTSTNRISVFPGRIMINGKMNYVNTRINISASDYQLNAISSCKIIVLIGAGSSNMITQSDIKFTDAAQISASLAWNNDKQGYYPSVASGTRRALMVFIEGQDANFIDPPWDSHFYTLTNGEMSALGFKPVGSAVVSSVIRIFDQKERSYYYNARGAITTATGVHQVSTPPSPPDLYRYDYFYGVKDNAGTQTQFNVATILVTGANSGALTGLFDISGGLNPQYTVYDTAVSNLYFNMKLSKINSLASESYRKDSNRG